jgi:hypothetical protein
VGPYIGALNDENAFDSRQVSASIEKAFAF